jgi:glycosyltransferase involved in cell wall biosynthesis
LSLWGTSWFSGRPGWSLSGNKDQVVHRNNGYLCDNVEDFAKWIGHLVENPEAIKVLGRNAALYSRQFTSENVIKRYLEFIAA